jgi:hypothetical protein
MLYATSTTAVLLQLKTVQLALPGAEAAHCSSCELLLLLVYNLAYTVEGRVYFGVTQTVNS